MRAAMGGVSGVGFRAALLALLLASCAGGEGAGRVTDAGPEPQPPAPDAGERPTLGERPPHEQWRPRAPLPTEPLVFQPAFHQALRWSETVGSLTTFRMKLPMGRAGQRLRVRIKAGDGPLTLGRVSVARPGEAPVEVRFSGTEGALLSARESALSDAVDFAVAVGEELLVSFEAQGAVARSAIDAFPGSELRAGAHALETTLAGSAWVKGAGVTSVEVEAAQAPALVAIGDSITEGFISGVDDYRQAWPFVAQTELGVPVANAAVSGQGVEGALQHLEEDTLVLEGITDCVLLIGTNDLHRETAWVLSTMETLIGRLKPRCRVWLATLLPRERVSVGELATSQARRLEINDWIRARTDVAGVIDLEAVTRTPADPHQFLEGLDEDGVHPSVEGQRVLGLEAARFFEQQAL